MGLDMYLEARKYVSKNDWTAKADENGDLPTNAEYNEIAKFFPAGADEYGSHSGAEAKITVAYWRKANAIHNWFVNECGGGVDECQPIGVPHNKLRELRATVEHTIETKDPKHLATASGFFFGSTDYDEYYWGDLERTLKILDKVIPLAEEEDWSLIYQASW